jgi:hypothetical protein
MHYAKHKNDGFELSKGIFNQTFSCLKISLGWIFHQYFILGLQLC